MRNGYNQHHHQQQQLYHHIRNSSGSFFFPILCKLSIKDVKLQNPSSSGDNLNEPSSPKVSCMGQVKRNNKVIGFPTPYRPTTSSTAISGPVNPRVKYTKLKKLFSGKNFTAGNNRELKTSVTVTVGGSRKSTINDKGRIIKGAVEVINVGELDPPLPVVKKVKPPPEDGGLWKRRSGAVKLTSLQIQPQIHLPTDNNLLQPTTV
ncbi:PREDICTED: uncharacterized protein LOC109224561 [Nicotiana attenuata]|uniref:Uncharacterized protein n=1 Tax=Nicotiana attenuata TaxID=49451 RepID=A0A1J6IIN0_NICAT|nr:PREDICTED: uncharacterized protein LOC109224561 [Nicotiana attenuata]OIT04554.1 hypothetical protein A4A49_29378 [Nicotiana attenuata]